MAKAITLNTKYHVQIKTKDLGEGGKTIVAGYHAKHSKQRYCMQI